MSKKENKQKKQSFIKKTKRADGSSEYSITKAPQQTLWGKVIIITLALLLFGSAILSLVFILLQA